jgi:hypothetical protein
MRARLKERCDILREVVWKQPKFGLKQDITTFGLYISKRMSIITRRIF